jgi:enamine deaminase RidA (YjgF/YER057c/UK114 family)
MMKAQSTNDAVYLNPEGLWTLPIFTQVIIAPRNGRTVYISGQVAFDAAGKLIGEGDVGLQIDAAFANMRRALTAAGAKPEHVLKVMHFFVNYSLDCLDPMFRALKETFPADRMPTSTLICIPRLARDGLLYEIQAEAVIPD